MIFRLLTLLCCLLFASQSVTGQDCVGGQIYTNDAYLYGRFEVSMRSAPGNGIVSSFFLYNFDVNCNWPAVNNEIDIEMTGNNQLVQFTTHYPSLMSYTNAVDPVFNPHEGIHDYAIEWEPGIVRWFVEGELTYVQDQPYVNDLIHPMRIMMNLWVSESIGWVGPWDPSIMPVDSEYDRVRYFAYTPGTGNAGTNNNFTFAWNEEFNSYNPDRWTISQDAGFGSNLCRFRASSVVFNNSKLYLQLEPPLPVSTTIPVTFSVNTNEQNLMPGDFIYLNGNFNGWCGLCNPMTEADGIWSTTIDLPPGRYEYLFTKNFWEENGSAPLGSECDFTPCDEWLNYGLVVEAGSDPIVLDTPCWGTCDACTITSVEEVPATLNRQLIKVCDLLGREATYSPGQILIYYFDDGSVEQRVGF